MKTCADIRAAIVRGEGLADAESKAHLATCPACTTLAEDPDTLAHVLRDSSVAPVRAEEIDALLPGLQARLATERGPRAWLSSRPTWARTAIATAAALLVVAAVMILRPRPDLEAYPLPRLALLAFALGTLTLGSIVLALQPAFRPSPAPRTLYTVLAIVLFVLLVHAVFPYDTGHPAAQSGTGDQLIPLALPCFGFGMLLAIPVYALVRLLDRRTQRLAAVLAASAAGITANLALTLHCPLSSTAHIALGHVTVAIVIAGVDRIWSNLRGGKG